MDPFTATAASIAALASLGTAVRWRTRAYRAEAEIGLLRLELQAANHAASHDPLTGLPNRRAFYLLGAESIVRPTHRPVVVLVDLDDFKQVNDEFGHAAGDEVLVTVARRFAAYAGDNLVARLGGDEFVGLLTSPVFDERWRHHTSHRLAEILAAPMRISGRDLVVTASVGLASINEAGDLSEAVRRADAAMYVAKTRTRARRRCRLSGRTHVANRNPILDEHLAG
ncbi:MAG: GGDEF domain-containing protein [Micromonosporaceae bacterium]|nr:GGDEF domain-containing protein [Micromonosporaceae bacterium]